MNKLLDLMEMQQLHGPASPDLVSRVQATLHMELPNDYIQFMLEHNGGEGFVGQNHYVVLWRLEDLVDLNIEYGAQKINPKIVLFGTNGGNEGFGFTVGKLGLQVVMAPLLDLDPNDWLLEGYSFSDFIERRFSS